VFLFSFRRLKKKFLEVKLLPTAFFIKWENLEKTKMKKIMGKEGRRIIKIIMNY